MRLFEGDKHSYTESSEAMEFIDLSGPEGRKHKNHLID